MGMPRSVLRRAEELGGGERKTLEGLIAEMEEHVRHADEEAKQARSERIDMEHTRRKYDTLLNNLEEKRDELMREAVKRSEEIMNGGEPQYRGGNPFNQGKCRIHQCDKRSP